jgi:hypothetical protein
MAQFLDRNLVERASTAMLLGTLWLALATWVLAALAYDVCLGLAGNDPDRHQARGARSTAYPNGRRNSVA